MHCLFVQAAFSVSILRNPGSSPTQPGGFRLHQAPKNDLVMVAQRHRVSPRNQDFMIVAPEEGISTRVAQ